MDISADEADPHHLRMVLAPNDTPASKLLLPRRLKGLPPDVGKALPYYQFIAILPIPDTVTYTANTHTALSQLRD